MTALDVSTPHHRDSQLPAPVLRLQVLARRGRIDRLLAEGHDPRTDPQLALRAGQLARPAARARVAAALHKAVLSIDESALTRHRSPEVPVDATSVRACAAEIRELAGALTDPGASVHGVAIARGLLTDSTGPLYAGGQHDRLRTVVVAARAAL